MTELTSENIAEVAAKQELLVEEIATLSLSKNRNLEKLSKGKYSIDLVDEKQWLENAGEYPEFVPIVMPEQATKAADSENTYMERSMAASVVTGIAGAIAPIVGSAIFITPEFAGWATLSVLVGSPIIGALSFFGVLFPTAYFNNKGDNIYKVINIAAHGFQKWVLAQYHMNLPEAEAVKVVTKLLYSGSRNEKDCVVEYEGTNYVFHWDEDKRVISRVKSESVTKLVESSTSQRSEQTESQEPAALPSDIQSFYLAILSDLDMLISTDSREDAIRIQKQLETMVNDYRKVAHLDDNGLAADKLMALVSLLQDEVQVLKRRVLEAGLASLDIHREYLILRQKHQGTAHPIQIEN